MGGNDGDSAQPTSKAGSKQLQTKGLNSHKKAGKAVAFSPNGLVLASTSYTTVRLWNTATGKEVQELKGHRGAVNAIAFSPDGKTVASASDDSTVRFWHVATGLETQELEGHGGAVNAIAFSPDGEIVASASEDSTVRLWHVATGLEIHQLEGHNNAVRAIAFSPDGKVVASTSDDSTVRLWDAAAGKQLQKHENPHYDLPTISSINLKTNPFNEPDGSDPTLKLNKAIRRRDTNSVITLIASGVDVNRPFNVNRSPNGSKREWFGTPRLPEGYPIYHAAEVGEEITQLLIDAGARVNTSFRALGTALQNAAARGTYETMELLIAAGADVNASPGARGTPLIAAITDARYGFRKVRLLLRHGAEVCTPPSAGICTPIEEAMMEGHTELVPLLVAHGVSIADAVEAWKKNSDRQFPELWLQLSRKRPYNSVSQVMIDIEDASAVKTIRSIKLDWKSPDLLGSENKSDPVSMHEEHPLVDSYMEQFVLVDECPEGSDVDTVLGATCLDCVHDHWGQDAVAFLRCLLSNVLSQRQGNSEHKAVAHTHRGVLPCEYISKIRLSDRQIDLELHTTLIVPQILHIILDVASFFCRAIKSPESSKSLVKTSSAIHVHISPLKDVEIACPLTLYVSVEEEPLPTHESSCWQNLLNTGIVAKRGKRLHMSSTPGRGLSVSFEDMLMLASIDYSAVIDQTIVFLGYRTALLPVEIHDDHVQYHLLVCKSGQIDPFQFPKELGLAVKVGDINELRKRRSAIGWCQDACIGIGTGAVTSDSIPRDSGAEPKERSLQLNGIALGLSIVSAAPIQAGPTLQVSGKFTFNRIQFPFSEVYSQILRDTSREAALLYDTDSKRGWIVPKLYLLLHMCHTHMAIRKEHDAIPSVSDKIDPKSLVDTLDGKGDLVLYGVEPDQLRFRTLLRGLNVNLLTAALKTQTPKKDTLYGFDFIDMVERPGKGAWMRSATIKNGESYVVEMANLVDAVIIGACFQNVIQSRIQMASASPSKCISVPNGFDYLTVPVSCLMKLVSDRHKVNGSVMDFNVEIANGLYWVVSMESFAPCKHSEANQECCWYTKETFQYLRRETFPNLRRYGLFQTKPAAGGTRQMSLSSIPAGGAVVFGKPQRP